MSQEDITQEAHKCNTPTLRLGADKRHFHGKKKTEMQHSLIKHHHVWVQSSPVDARRLGAPLLYLMVLHWFTLSAFISYQINNTNKEQ